MKREIRSGAITSVAGVGAIVDVGHESFIIPGIDGWREAAFRHIDLPRLSRRIGFDLRVPRDDGAGILVRRFPRWLFCEDCRHMTHWRTEMEPEEGEPACPRCGKKALVPMRFVIACDKGHLDDVDWPRWAHSGDRANKGCRDKASLVFEVNTAGGTAGLESLQVRCTNCNSHRSLEQLTANEIARTVFGRCGGRHPWRMASADTCGAAPEVLQRGATNLHYPVTRSALDIPAIAPEDDYSAYAPDVAAHRRFARLQELLGAATGDTAEFIELLEEQIARDTGCPIAGVREIAKTWAGSVDQPAEVTLPDQSIFLDEEWETLSRSLAAGGIHSTNFIATAEPLDPGAPPWAGRLVKGILLLHRLREVRAYLGFERVRPGGADSMIPADVGHPVTWRPASEIFGEGIFIAFDNGLIGQWEQGLPSEKLAALRALEQRRVDENFWFLPPITPRMLAIHALSHLLLRRITFECGYASSSLRERLYIDAANQQAGMMIYTADGDSEGSLGGLVRQGRRDRFAQTLFEAVEQGRWCSADPVCSETAGQGLGGFNHAACHACLLVSETSCTFLNTVLDRSMLIDENFGLLSFAGGI